MDVFPLINIHTHSPARPGEWVIQNIHKDFFDLPPAFFSAGLHPWYVSAATWQQQLNTLKEISANTRMMALGECGLDKVCTTRYELQIEVFTAHIKLANQVKKPLILHCVRAHEDVLHLLEKHHSTVPVIFHGFNKGGLLAQRIVDKGYFLSFGKDLQRPHMPEIFAGISMTHLFLETDDANTGIEGVYNTAAGIRNISLEELSLQLKQNLQKVFNISV
ncbi:MAG: TatD family hydrolase [Rhizobacter sp.]|nr:TatD family hydrolase [Ferruginibacter sp.]